MIAGNSRGRRGPTGALRLGWRWDKPGLSRSLQAEEDKEEQTDRQPDASSSQTVTLVAEPPSAEPTPPEGPTSLGPLDLLPNEELLTDTSNSSSSTGEEGEAGGPRLWLQWHVTDLTLTGFSKGFVSLWD